MINRPNPMLFDDIISPVERFINHVVESNKRNVDVNQPAPTQWDENRRPVQPGANPTPPVSPAANPASGRTPQSEQELQRHIKQQNDAKLADPTYSGWVKEPDGSLVFRNPRAQHNPDNALGITKTQFKGVEDQMWRDKFAGSDDERVQRLAARGQKGTAEDPYSWIKNMTGEEAAAPTRNLRDAYTVIKNKSGLNPSGEVWQQFLATAPAFGEKWYAAAPPEAKNSVGYYEAMIGHLEGLMAGGNPTTNATTVGDTGGGTTSSGGGSGSSTTLASGAPNLAAITGVQSQQTIRDQQELNKMWDTATDEQKAAITAQLAGQADLESGGEAPPETTAGFHNFKNMAGPSLKGDFGEAPIAKIFNAVFGR